MRVSSLVERAARRGRAASCGGTRRTRARRRPGRRPPARPSAFRLCSTARQRTAVGPDAGDADAQAVAGRRRPRRSRSRTSARAAGAASAPTTAPSVSSTRSRARAARCGRRRGSPRRAPCARRPCRPSGHARRARSAAPRGRRAGRRDPAARRGCRRSSRPRAPRGRRPARAKRREQPVVPSASAATGTIAPIRIDVAVDVGSRRGRCGAGAARGPASSRPAASSGMRIVPPAKTVTPVAVAEELHGLVGGTRERAPRRSHAAILRWSRAARVERAVALPLRSARAVRLDRRARVGARRSVVSRPTAGSRRRSTSR